MTEALNSPVNYVAALAAFIGLYYIWRSTSIWNPPRKEENKK